MEFHQKAPEVARQHLHEATGCKWAVADYLLRHHYPKVSCGPLPDTTGSLVVVHAAHKVLPSGAGLLIEHGWGIVSHSPGLEVPYSVELTTLGVAVLLAAVACVSPACPACQGDGASADGFACEQCAGTGDLDAAPALTGEALYGAPPREAPRG